MPPALADDKSAPRPWILPSESPYTREQTEKAGDTLASIEGCSKRLPRFADDNRELINTWKSQNSGVIRAAEDNELTGSRIRRARTETPPVATAKERNEIEVLCENLTVRVLGKKVSTPGSEAHGATPGG